MRKLGLIIAGALILCGAAFYNGYPLLYSDTGTYLFSGFTGLVPLDRPITYGLFVRHMSLAVSLWWVAIAQALIVSYVLYQSLDTFFGRVSRPVFLAVISFLSLFTALSWYTGEIMPDIFAPIGVLCLASLLLPGRQATADTVLLSLLLVLSAIIHSSHVLIYLLVCMLITAIWLYRKTQAREHVKPKRLVLVWLLVVSSWVLLPLINYNYGGGFTINKGSHAYIMSRMLDTGILQQYLDEQCAEKNYRICAYKDSLPLHSRDFLWSAGSPMHREGGFDATAKEYNSIISATLTSPKYMVKHMAEAAKATGRQLFENSIGAGFGPYYEGSPPYEEIKKRFPHELKAFDQSRQNFNIWDEALDFTFINNCQYFLLGLTVLGLIIYYSGNVWKAVMRRKNIFIVIILSGIFFNAAVTATLGAVYDRLQSRIVWLLPMLLILLLLDKDLRGHIRKTYFSNHNTWYSNPRSTS